jgi:deoxyuridine 5'-triphosphate nucleotidohydrolase
MSIDLNLASYFKGRCVFLNNDNVLTCHVKQVNFLVSILARLQLPKRYSNLTHISEDTVTIQVQPCIEDIDRLFGGKQFDMELFLRGVYEGYAQGKENELPVTFEMTKLPIFNGLAFSTTVPDENGSCVMIFEDTSKFLQLLYKNNLDIGSQHYLRIFHQISRISESNSRKSKGPRKSSKSKRPIKSNLEFFYSLNNDQAVAPVKLRNSDAGYDLTLISVHKTVGNTVFYNTGVSVQPPKNMYFDLVARSSITKTGYILANGIGIIDNEYRGDILVALMKIDPNAEDLQLPSRLVQIVPRVCLDLTPVKSESLSLTERDTKGFGSSNPITILKKDE